MHIGAADRSAGAWRRAIGRRALLDIGVDSRFFSPDDDRAQPEICFMVTLRR